MKPEFCPICGANLALVGRMHRCVPRQDVAVLEPMHATTASRPHPSPNSASPNKHYARNARWREKNRDRYNATMRGLMRRKRANEKNAPTAA